METPAQEVLAAMIPEDLQAHVDFGAVVAEPENDPELADILATLDLTATLGSLAEIHRAASVAGVHVEDMGRFLDGDASLTWAARARLREWAASQSSEIERAPYEIPAATRVVTIEEAVEHVFPEILSPPASPILATPRVPPLTNEQREASMRYSREASPITMQLDAPPCPQCSDLMVRNGSCYRCHNCGITSGCS